ncbi:helix-turn-helix domain-containing protein [Oceaniglobus roseus]|uniref:helix-turn-helix domain-containing protein n=1 Tax=Oceaniglobus roseus TaxID=1737570 RepID=UPI000C7EF424|nr:XRE family transcriptional regulator [Kandeliimicrobium roseum]
MKKTLVGSQLRQLRRARNHTQAEMAQQLGVSPAYVNLLENNQRSLSVKMLLALTEAYGVDWRKLVNSNEGVRLADLRGAVRDPAFAGLEPDLQELRAALDHAPRLVELFLHLYQNHRKLLDNMLRLSASGLVSEMIVASPETMIHDFFRDHSNHFEALEAAADAARAAIGGAPDDLYGNLKRHLREAHGIDVAVRDPSDMTGTLRLFQAEKGQVLLSAALDQVNRNFQLAHVLALAGCGELLDDLTNDAGISSDAGRARCRVELANYFSAALLMPYDAMLELAEATAYDIDRIAATFGVSFEQACQRLTTLQRQGAQGVPFFFLRIDRAGNVTKRFNATAFTLAEQGGACPVWNIHSAFAAPGVIVPQFVELPDAGQYFTISRTTDRPVVSRVSQDRRLVVTLGCERAHVRRIGYAAAFNPEDEANVARIGINCHVCTRQACAQRAHEPLHADLPVDTNRRGSTRYES